MNATLQTQAYSQDLLKSTRDVLSAAGILAKDYSLSTGLTAYDLQAPGKNLYPVETPIRNALPRVARANPGDAAHWKTIYGIVGSGAKSMGWVPEGQRSARMSIKTTSRTATYKTFGEEDQASFESINAGVGFEDIQATMRLRLMQQTMIKEEFALLGGNANVSVLAPTNVAVTGTEGTGTLPAATYNVYVVALTFEGMEAATVNLAGLPQAVAITGADGLTFTLNGGSSNKSTVASATLANPGNLAITWDYMNGAVAYGVYVGTAGNELLQSIVSINSAVIGAALVTGTQNASAITANCSANPGYAFDGLLYTALGSFTEGNAIVNTMPQAVGGTGGTLTADGAGGIVEFEAILKQMWDAFRLGPTVIWVNAEQVKDIKAKVLSGPSPSSLLHVNIDGNAQDGFSMTAGGVIANYFNMYDTNGGYKVPIKLHPNVPAGTVLFQCERLPARYQSNNTPNVAEVLTRKDYYGIDWPITTRQRGVGVYSEEVLAVYAPFGMAVLRNINKG